LIGDLEQEQVTYLDLTDYRKNQNSDLFWNQDYHLNEKGHLVGGASAFPVLFGSLDRAFCSRTYPVKAPPHKNT